MIYENWKDISRNIKEDDWKEYFKSLQKGDENRAERESRRQEEKERKLCGR